MSNCTVFPRRISGVLTPPASKSHVHRLMIVSALSGHPLTIFGNLKGDDIEATARCLQGIGVGVERGEGYIRIIPGTFRDGVMDAGESGSTLRMLLPVVPVFGVRAEFRGSGRLPFRPIGDIISLMRASGAEVDGEVLPLKAGGSYSTNAFKIIEPASSQHISGLLMALAGLGGGRIDIFGNLPSRGYVDMTIEVLREYGVEIVSDSYGFTVKSGFKKFPESIAAEGDWSGAAAIAAAAAVAGKVTIEGLKYPSSQPDSAVLRLMSAAGAKVQVFKNGELCSVEVSKGRLKAIDFDADASPDIVPVLAAALAYAYGESSISGVERLKIKESDRISSVVDALNAVGIRARYDGACIGIEGGVPKGGVVDSAGDHRIAMLGAILALAAEAPIKILGAECVGKSYEGFFKAIEELGGKTEWQK